MPLTVFGVNHKTAPVEVRERLALNDEALPAALDSLLREDAVTEALILSTCNRLEVYCVRSKNSELDFHLDWISRHYGLDRSRIEPYLYSYPLTDAIRHVLRVACGLDSMILGEPQILGQLKTSYQRALSHGSLGKLLDRLFQHAFSVAKQVRTDTAIGSSPVSVAFAGVRLAQQIFGDLQAQTALLIGAGETMELVARHLHEQRLERMIIANRTLEKAQHLATEFGAYAIQLANLHDHLHEADIVFTSTASSLPILGKGAVEQALKKRRHRPMFMVDIAVPRDIEPEIAELEDVYLYSVDDLQAVIEENLNSRREAAQQADEIIETAVEHFLDWLHSLNAVDTITALREQIIRLGDAPLAKARKRLARGDDPVEVLASFQNALCAAIAHQPSVRLREAGINGRTEVLAITRELFGLDKQGQD